MPYVARDNLSIHYRIDGKEGAPWLVFSNSLLTDLTLWNAQAAHFASRFRVLRYDQRGHGATTVPPQPTSLDELVDDAATLLDEIGVRAATFVGASMGAATGLCLAARRPDLIGRVVAADGQCRTAPGGARTWQDRIDFAREHGIPALERVTSERWFGRRFLAESPDAARMRAMMRATPLEGFAACATALQGYDFAAELPQIRQKALLIAGANDGAMPESMRQMAARLPNARFVEIPGAGHLPNIEQPETFNAALEAFLDEPS